MRRATRPEETMIDDSPFAPLEARAAARRASRASAVNRTQPTDLMSGLAVYDAISLAEMDAVALLSRTDTKFLLRVEQLTEALPLLGQHYRVLEVAGSRLSPYQTLYFDTPDFALYRWHHAGGRNRYKVRSREYLQTRAAFFEVKHKVNRFQTIKERIPTRQLVTRLTPETDRFLRARLPEEAAQLQPKLWNLYGRITLVNRFFPERVTLDLDLRFDNSEVTQRLPGLVTAEVKQAGRPRPTAFIQLMRRLSIRAGGFSKYCIGVSLTYPHVKHNNFLAQLRTVASLTDGGDHVRH